VRESPRPFLDPWSSFPNQKRDELTTSLPCRQSRRFFFCPTLLSGCALPGLTNRGGRFVDRLASGAAKRTLGLKGVLVLCRTSFFLKLAVDTSRLPPVQKSFQPSTHLYCLNPQLGWQGFVPPHPGFHLFSPRDFFFPCPTFFFSSLRSGFPPLADPPVPSSDKESTLHPPGWGLSEHRNLPLCKLLESLQKRLDVFLGRPSLYRASLSRSRDQYLRRPSAE